MPWYEYECPECGHVEELDRKIAERDTLVFCSECHSVTKRCIGSAGFILKGNCWSRDNYARVLGDDPRYNGREWKTRE